MPLDVYKGTFTKALGIGNQAIVGVGFQPVALMLWTDTQVAYGRGDIAHRSFAFTDGVVSISHCCESRDNVAPSAVNLDDRINFFPRLEDSFNAATGTATFVSFDPNGFTLNWTFVDGAATIIHFLALGGTDITNVVAGRFAANVVPGNQAVVGLGFQPEFIMFNAYTNSWGNFYWGMLGAASGATERGYSAFMSANGQNPTRTARRQRADRCLGLTNALGAARCEADFVSFDPNGFTLNWIVAPPVAWNLGYLALAGGSYRVGSFNQAVGIGNQSIVGTGFQPTGLMLSSINNITAAVGVANAYVSLGASDATREGCTWAGDTHNVAPSIGARSTSNTKVIQHITPAAIGAASVINAEADLVSFDGDGFTLGWTTADAVAREIIYIAFGNTGGGVRDVVGGMGMVPWAR